MGSKKTPVWLLIIGTDPPIGTPPHSETGYKRGGYGVASLIYAREKLAVCDVTNFPCMDIQ